MKLLSRAVKKADPPVYQIERIEGRALPYTVVCRTRRFGREYVAIAATLDEAHRIIDRDRDLMENPPQRVVVETVT